MAGMSVRSARKWQSGSLPSETSQDRWWRIRPDPFDGIWQEEMLLPSFLREYGKLFAQYAAEGVDHPQYLLRLADLEIINRHQRMVERRIRAARFPAVKGLDTSDLPDIPSVNKALVMELARCGCIQRWENVIAIVNSGTGKTHIGLSLGLATCQRGMAVGFTTAAGLVHK